MPRKKKSDEAQSTPDIKSGIWDLNIGELAGHNIESEGRKEVNKMLSEGWVLLHIYTLKYNEDGTWRERPMAILGKISSSKNLESETELKKSSSDKK